MAVKDLSSHNRVTCIAIPSCYVVLHVIWYAMSSALTCICKVSSVVGARRENIKRKSIPDAEELVNFCSA